MTSNTYSVAYVREYRRCGRWTRIRLMNQSIRVGRHVSSDFATAREIGHVSGCIFGGYCVQIQRLYSCMKFSPHTVIIPESIICISNRTLSFQCKEFKEGSRPVCRPPPNLCLIKSARKSAEPLSSRSIILGRDFLRC
jgi:hypothetical protein